MFHSKGFAFYILMLGFVAFLASVSVYAHADDFNFTEEQLAKIQKIEIRGFPLQPLQQNDTPPSSSSATPLTCHMELVFQNSKLVQLKTLQNSSDGCQRKLNFISINNSISSPLSVREKLQRLTESLQAAAIQQDRSVGSLKITISDKTPVELSGFSPLDLRTILAQTLLDNLSAPQKQEGKKEERPAPTAAPQPKPNPPQTPEPADEVSFDLLTNRQCTTINDECKNLCSKHKTALLSGSTLKSPLSTVETKGCQETAVGTTPNNNTCTCQFTSDQIRVSLDEKISHDIFICLDSREVVSPFQNNNRYLEIFGDSVTCQSTVISKEQQDKQDRQQIAKAEKTEKEKLEKLGVSSINIAAIKSTLDALQKKQQDEKKERYKSIRNETSLNSNNEKTLDHYISTTASLRDRLISSKTELETIKNELEDTLKRKDLTPQDKEFITARQKEIEAQLTQIDNVLPAVTADLNDAITKGIEATDNTEKYLSKMDNLFPSPSTRSKSNGSSTTSSEEDATEIHVEKSKDACSESVMAALVDQARSSGEEVNNIAQLKEYYRKHKDEMQSIEEQYGCSADMNTLRTKKFAVDAAGAVAKIGAEVVGMKAAADTQKTAAKGGDVFKAGAKNMADAQIAAGTTQSSAGLFQLAMGLYEATGNGVKGHQDDTIAEIKKLQSTNNSGIRGEGGKNYSVAGASAAMQDDEDNFDSVKAANKEGAGRLAASLSQHEAVRKDADEFQTKSIIDGAVQLAQGLAQVWQGFENKKKVKKFNSPTPTPPLVPSTPNGNINDVPPPPSFNSTGAALDNSPIEGEQSGDDTKEDPQLKIPSPLRGPSAPGGLKDTPIAGNGGGLVGQGKTEGHGGGGGGGAGGGSGGFGPKSGESQAKGAESFTSRGPTFEGGGAPGGLTFGAAGGGNNAKRVDSTGMDLSGLISQFLPKKEEEKEKENTGLDYGSSRRNISSEQDDGSILGPRSNLFTRASLATLKYYRQGKLR